MDLYQAILNMSESCWAFRPLDKLALEYNESVKTTYDVKDPNYCDPPDEGPVMVCGVCGDEDIDWDTTYCNKCERYTGLQPREQYLDKHPEDRVE